MMIQLDRVLYMQPTNVFFTRVIKGIPPRREIHGFANCTQADFRQDVTYIKLFSHAQHITTETVIITFNQFKLNRNRYEVHLLIVEFIAF